MKVALLSLPLVLLAAGRAGESRAVDASAGVAVSGRSPSKCTSGQHDGGDHTCITSVVCLGSVTGHFWA